MGFDWLAWLGNLVKVVGDLVPQRVKVPPTHRVVLFRSMTKCVVLREGCYWYWPWTSSLVTLPIKRQVLVLSTQCVVTQDEKPAQVEGIVSYTIGDTDDEIIRAAVEAYNVDASIDDEAVAVLCSLITGQTFSQVQDNRKEFNRQFTHQARIRLREYGLRVKRAQLTTFVTGVPLLHFSSTGGPST